MAFIKSSILVLVSFILFLVAVCLILAGLMTLNQSFTAWLIHEIQDIRNPAPFILGGAIVFGVSIILYNLATRKPDAYAVFTFESEKGPIHISLRAIEDYINKQFEGKYLVNSIRSKVSTSKDRKRLRVHANVGVRSEQNLKSAGDTLQKEITLRLLEGLGLDNVDKVSVSVDKIIVSKAPRPAAPAKASDEAQ